MTSPIRSPKKFIEVALSFDDINAAAHEKSIRHGYPPSRHLAYTLCEHNKWADDTRNYNELATAWHGIEATSHEAGQVNVRAARTHNTFLETQGEV